MTKEAILEKRRTLFGNKHMELFSDTIQVCMDEYAKPYKEIAELVSSIFFYGNFKVETPAEAELEKKLNEVGLWPTTEDEIIKRKYENK